MEKSPPRRSKIIVIELSFYRQRNKVAVKRQKKFRFHRQKA